MKTVKLSKGEREFIYMQVENLIISHAVKKVVIPQDKMKRLRRLQEKVGIPFDVKG